MTYLPKRSQKQHLNCQLLQQLFELQVKRHLFLLVPLWQKAQIQSHFQVHLPLYQLKHQLQINRRYEHGVDDLQLSQLSKLHLKRYQQKMMLPYQMKPHRARQSQQMMTFWLALK
jgi:GGDEF domain-containing protein